MINDLNVELVNLYRVVQLHLEEFVKPLKNATAQEKQTAEDVYEWLDDIEYFEMFLFEAMGAVGQGYIPSVGSFY